MNKRQFISLVSEKISKSYFDTKIIIDDITSIIEEVLLSWDTVNLQGFGNFSVSKRKSRNWVNPRTKAKIIVNWYSTPIFRAWTPFKSKIKNKF